VSCQKYREQAGKNVGLKYGTDIRSVLHINNQYARVGRSGWKMKIMQVLQVSLFLFNFE
jgi:hypothetical protein